MKREYERQDGRTNGTENEGRGPIPNTQATLNFAADVRARFFVFPERRFKLTPGIGITILALAPFNITPEASFSYSPRPATAVVGLTPVFGFNVALVGRLSFFLDGSITVYLDRGLADDEFVNPPETASEYLGTASYVDIQAPSQPLMGRITVGVSIAF